MLVGNLLFVFRRRGGETPPLQYPRVLSAQSIHSAPTTCVPPAPVEGATFLLNKCSVRHGATTAPELQQTFPQRPRLNLSRKGF